MTNAPESTETVQAVEDLAELQFTPIPADDAAELDDRAYLLGIRCENVRA